MIVPNQLQDTSFRFYLIASGSKIPSEKEWTSKNNYFFFDPKLMEWPGNYGIVAGYGNLIIIDFDDIDYYNQVKCNLPETFTVKSAGRGLPHLYYILSDKIIKKTNIRDKDNKVLCDIQAVGSGVVGPGSSYDRKFYKVINDKPIKEISLADLKAIFPIRERYKTASANSISNCDNPELVKFVIEGLLRLGIKRTGDKTFQCPFHAMNGKGNLSIIPNGFLYCFHEIKCWHDLNEFIEDYRRFQNGNNH